MPQQARNRLIMSTIDLMRRRGVAGTGINDIVENSGAARRSIYLNFPGGKDELVVAATSLAGRFIGGQIYDATDRSAADMLLRFVDLWRQTLSDSDFEAGCPVAAGALAGAAAPGAPAAAAATFGHWERKLVTRLVEDGIEEQEAARLAVTVVCAIEGAVVLSVCEKSLRPFDAIESVLLGIIRASGTPAR